MDDLVQFLRDRLDEDERAAQAASGGTVVDEAGRWRTSPTGDEWEASRTDCDEDELLVALRPGLPRPPDVMSGLWGAVVSFKPEFEDPGTASPLAAFQHAARHDPARVLAEVDAKRRTVALCEPPLVETTGPGDTERSFIPGEGPPWGLDVLKLLALPYANHPAYREEWRP